MDLFFSVHALVISLIIFSLSFYYPRKSNKGHFGPYIMILILMIFAVIFYFTNTHYSLGKPDDIWIFMGMGKSIVSTLKYCYQIYLNKDKKSTEGFSIGNVILDAIGGLLSLIGESLKVYYDKSSYLDNKTNIPKIVLSLTVMFFDGILVFQHYVAYK